MRAWTLASRPAGLPNDSNFAMVETPDAPLGADEFRVANSWLSVDPYMRGRMDAGPSYAQALEPGGVMEGGSVCEVLASRDAAFKAGELERDVVVVVRFQGPRANGMPELHKLTPPLGVLQDKGFNVALVTDGRMSGASGKVPAAIHLSPEAARGGAIAKLQDGDIVRLCANSGTLSALVDADIWAARAPAPTPARHAGTGRELFALMRAGADEAEKGGSAMLAVAGL